MFPHLFERIVLLQHPVSSQTLLTLLEQEHAYKEKSVTRGRGGLKRGHEV